MKPINNITLMGCDGVLAESCLSDEMTQIVVPENGLFSAYILHMVGNIHLKVVLDGEDAKCDIKIVYLSNKNNKNIIKVEVIHKHKNTTSSHTIKGVLTDSSKMVFDGIIRIPKDSQKCDGYLNHRAVLLSDNAKVKATPELEIYADDVKCSHGSAVGSLDENLLFYLMSRGIGAEEGKRILLKSFLSDSLPDSFETYIDEWMDENV
ncbi:MAG: SufD family Fe-S cluster assembly protein [Alphaproteobacteria bacterium]|nr:SufD family Fe-S cluster assembly protein [Alphaproteobacteria bacterium]